MPMGIGGEAWDVALQIAALREKAGLSQRDLARKLHTSQQQISRLESPSYEGHSLSMLRRVAKALGATVRVTFDLTDAVQEVVERFGDRPLVEKEVVRAGQTITKTFNFNMTGERFTTFRIKFTAEPGAHYIVNAVLFTKVEPHIAHVPLNRAMPGVMALIGACLGAAWLRARRPSRPTSSAGSTRSTGTTPARPDTPSSQTKSSRCLRCLPGGESQRKRWWPSPQRNMSRR